MTLGHAFVADNNIDKARDNFLDAIKQARTESLRAQALLLAARAERALERYEEAFEHAAEAADLAPYETPLEVARAAYEAVQIVGCWSRTSEPPREVLEEALKLLYRAVRADAQWFAIAWIDPLIGHVPRCHALLSEIHSATVGAAERIAVAVIDLKNQLAAVDSQGARWAEECLAQIIRDGAKAWETKNFQDLSKIVTNGSVCAQELSSRWDAEVDLRFDALSRRLSSNQQANAGRQAEAAALHRLALEGQLAALKNELAQVKGWMIGKRKDIEERIQQIQLQMPILGLQQSADRRGLAMQSDMQESKGTESLRRQDEAIRELLQWFNDAVGGAKTAPFAAD